MHLKQKQNHSKDIFTVKQDLTHNLFVLTKAAWSIFFSPIRSMGLCDKVKALRRVGGRQGPSCSAGNSDTSKRRRWPKNLRHCQTASHWSVTTARLQYFELQTSASCTARTTHFNWKAQTQTTAARSPQCGSAVKIASVWLQVNENFNTLKKNVLKDKKITVKMNQKCQLSKNQAVSLAVTKWILLSSFAIFMHAQIKRASFIQVTALCGYAKRKGFYDDMFGTSCLSVTISCQECLTSDKQAGSSALLRRILNED